MEEENREVRILSKEEKEQYQGITIDESTGHEYEPQEEQERPWTNGGMKVKLVSFSTMPLWKKCLYGAILALVIGSFLFLGGFLLMAIVGVGLLLWLWKLVRSLL